MDMKNRKILIFESPHTLANYLLQQWGKISGDAIEQRSRFNVALSGGRSPLEFYCRLSGNKDYDLWKKTHVFMADERFVPPDDKDSNFRLLQENLFNYVNIPQENIHAIPTYYENVLMCVDHYKNEMQYAFNLKPNEWPCLDLVMLGMGEDGHTASLFPEDENVDDPNRMVLPVSIDHLKHERISLSLPVINHARNIIFVVQGHQKAEVLKQIIKEHKEVPVSKVKPIDGTLTFLLDKEAASQLSYLKSFTPDGQAISMIA